MQPLRIGVVGTSGHADRGTAPVIRGSAEATLADGAGLDPSAPPDWRRHRATSGGWVHQ